MSAICRWFKSWCGCSRMPRRYGPKGRERYCGRPCPRITPYVIVQFTDDFLQRTGIPYDDEVPAEKYLGRELWKQISGGDPRVKLRALFPIIKTAQFAAYHEFVKERAQRPLPNLRGVYQITGHRDTDFARIVKVLHSRPATDVIANSTYEEHPSLPPQVDPTGQPLVAQQRHLDPPFGAQLGGINARAVWAQQGSDGQGVRFADVERGWDLGHPDLPPQRTPGVAIPLLHGINDGGFDDHGVGVLGIICATDYAGGTNTIGGVGTTPRAQAYVSSWFMGYDDEWNEIENIPGAILAAATTLFTERQSDPEGAPFGEVLLVEATVDKVIDGATLQVPAEVNYYSWDQIDRARIAGITVVEAGGNGDKASTPVNVDRPDVTGANRDSGAILVSAAQPLGGSFQPLAWAPRGNRVDCFAWGYGVTTCHSTAWGPPGYPYRHDYDGTSAAAAIVAGAAACLQGLARVTPVGDPAVVKGLLTPDQVRKAFRDPQWSTAATDPSIGRMPDLGLLWNALVAGSLHV